MPDEARQRLRGLAASRRNLEIHEFVTDPCPLMERADAVIAMGGYNTVCEILASRKPALIVPRVRPRTEQLIRATCFARLGALDSLHPDQLSPAAIGAWLAARPPRPAVEHRFDFDGVARLPHLLAELFHHHAPEPADARP
jgi:predicted glycosyltransferase